MTCDRCGEPNIPAKPAFGCLLCVDCRSWLTSIATIAVQAERVSWAKPEALSDSAIEAITLAHANQRRAVKELARYQKFTMRKTDPDMARFQKR